METLVEHLQRLGASYLPDGDDSVFLRYDDHETIPIIRRLANELLISEKGEPRYTDIDALYRTYGYFIFPAGGGRSCLRTKKGVIVFG
jgi:hypothetical protein